ncbi:MAG: thiol:disulfide interchange protein DsbA/DsbL [Pseudomonadota bacterium]
MRMIEKFLLACVFFGVTVCASAAEPKAGVEYLVLPKPQATEPGKKIEVTEFFAYYCPHCNAFDPLLTAWVKHQGDTIIFKRVHVQRDANVLPQQRLFYTLEALNMVDQYHSRVFSAMHNDHLRLNRDELVFDWVEKAGINRMSFIDTYRSFGVQARVRRANGMMDAYKIDQWPMIAIDGRFLTSPSQANEGATSPQTESAQQQMALQVMDYLVAKAKAEKK